MTPSMDKKGMKGFATTKTLNKYCKNLKGFAMKVLYMTCQCNKGLNVWPCHRTARLQQPFQEQLGTKVCICH